MPTFTVIPETVRSMSPLIVDSDDDDDETDDEDEDEDDEDDDEPSEGVPIEQYRAWLGASLGFIMLSETLQDKSALYGRLVFLGITWYFFFFPPAFSGALIYSRLFLCMEMHNSLFKSVSNNYSILWLRICGCFKKGISVI